MNKTQIFPTFIHRNRQMKKLLCLAVIGFSCFLGCAPAENGNPGGPTDNTTQIEMPAELGLIENA
jgi:hypothetical protein